MFGWWLGVAAAQGARPAGEILRDLQHLRVVGTALYVAAHPDDENTRLIGWLEGHRGVRTAYLSMTRGDGGQNLIGPEQDELLGVLRTGELLAARGVDGGEQRFTRMRDFGYSKSPEETLRLWGHDEALEDVVRAIRELRPDVVITRFPTAGETHGHHLASARLAGEAFEKAADPAYVTEGLDPWRADRLLFNRSTFFLPPGTDTSAWAMADLGDYEPLLGASYGEIAARARTMHKSQGFGSSPSVGPLVDYFEGLAGTAVEPGGDLLAGLDLTWRRLDGGHAFDERIAKAVDRFDARKPWASLRDLGRAHELLSSVSDSRWRDLKRADLEGLVADCAGLWLTARASAPSVSPGGSSKVTLTALARAPVAVTLHSVSLLGVHPGGELEPNKPWTKEVTVEIPADAPLTRPHWLVAPATRHRYEVDAAHRNDADTPPSLVARFDVTVGGIRMSVDRPVEFATTDPVQGERRHPVEVLPPVTATFDAPSRVVPLGTTATARLTIRATSGPAKGSLALSAPAGVTVAPETVAYDLTAEHPQQVVSLALTTDLGAEGGAAPLDIPRQGQAPRPPGSLVVEGAYQERVLDYAHVPRRTVLTEASLVVVPLVVSRGDTQRVGYVQGPGDVVPDALRAMGYDVELLTAEQIASGDLSRFDAIMTGIRAYNTDPRLLALHPQLMAYVAGGGRLVVQYLTANRFGPLAGPIGPAPLEIGRGRVTDEAAPLVPVDPSDPVWTTPNALGPTDFDGWVQERGLYFAQTWDPVYRPLFSVSDPGEEPLQGGALVARHGDGVFVYTGLSLFRQLPAGVPGAYRLLANLLGAPL